MNTEFKEEDYVNIVMASDEKYVMQTGVAMFSIVHNLSALRRARFFLLVKGWGEEEKNKIRKLENCEINFIEMDEGLLSEYSLMDSIAEHIASLSTYYRIFIPSLLPKNISKVIYLDVDLFVDADISELYDTLPSDKLMGAIIDVGGVAFINGIALKSLRDWEFYKGKPYFNAGVYVLNVQLARKINLEKMILDQMKLHPKVECADQGYLNYVCGNMCSDMMVYCPIEWNIGSGSECEVNDIMNATGLSYCEIVHASQFPKLFHFTGPCKPWIPVSKPLSYAHVWHYYYRMSPFYAGEIEYRIEAKIPYKSFSIFGIPAVKISYEKAKDKTRGKLFGFLPLYQFVPRRYLKIEPMKIPLILVKWKGQEAWMKEDKKVICKLFGFLPLFSCKE